MIGVNVIVIHNNLGEYINYDNTAVSAGRNKGLP